MWDDEQDKEMMRNQMVAIVLMTVLLLGWFTFFVPPQPPVQPPPENGAPTPLNEPIDDPTAPPQTAQQTTSPIPSVTSQPGVWPNLPPVATTYDPATDDFVVEDDRLRLTFTRIGARLKSAEVLLTEEQGGTINLVRQAENADPAQSMFPFGLRFSEAALGDALDYRRWNARPDNDGQGVEFTLTLPGAAALKKHFRLNGRENVIEIETSYENLESQVRRLGLDLMPAYTLSWGPGIETGEDSGGFQKTYIWHSGTETEVLAASKLEDSITEAEGRRVPDADWIAHRGLYFVVALKSDEALPDGWLIGNEDVSRFGISTRRFELAPGESHVTRASAYLGPLHINELRAAWPGLQDSLRFFDSFDIMDSFAKLLLRMLNWFHDNTIANYGVAIILLTIVVRLVMMPLNIRMVANSKAMKELAPEMEALRKEYEDDQQVLGQKMMELYRDRGINPLSGCFPMLLQMPIFIALYRMLWQTFELRGASFLWIDDLSAPDALFRTPFLEGVPFIGFALGSFNLLPFLSAGAMLVSMRVMPTGGPVQNQQQKMIMNIMPVMFSVIMYNFSAGLNLYVFTSTLLGIVQQFALNPLVKTPKPKPKKAVDDRKKKKDFYTRALERQKEMEKAAKQSKKKKKNKKAQR